MATLEQLEDALRLEAQAGNTENQQKLSDAMRQHPTFQANAREKLESQAYRYDDNFNELSKDEQRKNMSKQIARSMGLNDDEVDVTQGMGLKGRFTLSFQPTEQDKFKELEDRYGRENVQAIDIGGKSKLLYRDEDETGGKFRAVDEEGTSLADFFGDTAGTAAPIAGAVGAAIATGGASIPLMAGAAALGGFGASAGQDVATRAVSGEDIRLGEIAKRRGIESAIGVPIDLATGGLGKVISGRIGKNIASDFVKNLEGAEKVLQKSEALSEAGLKLTPDMRVSEAATDAASGIAASRSGSKIAGQYQRLRDNISDYKNAITSGSAATGESFGKTAQRIAGEYKTLIDDVAKIDAGAAKVLRDSMGRRISGLAAKDSKNLNKMGERWMGLMGQGKEVTAAQSKLNFEEVGRLAREKGVSVSKQDVKGAIESALNRFKVKKNPEVNKILDGLDDTKLKADLDAGKITKTEYEAKIAELKQPMDFQTMREYIETIQDAVPEAGALGGRTSAQVASVAADSLRTLRDKVAKDVGGDDFARAYDDANKFYTDNMLQYSRGVGKRGTATAKGGDVATPVQVMDDILSDPAKIRQALAAIDPADEVASSEAKKELGEAFLSKIGFDSTNDLTNGITLSNAQETIIEELWSKSKVDSFKRLNRQVKQIKGADMSKVTQEEVQELFSAYARDDVDKVAKEIARRTAKQAEADELAANTILNKIIKGQYDDTNVAAFADVLINADAKQVKKAMEVLKRGSKEELEAVQQEFVSQLFAKFSNGAQLDSAGMGIWNAKAMQDALKGAKGSQLRSNLKSVMGDKANELIAANDVLAAASAVGKRATPEVKPRFILSPGSIGAYLVGDVMGGVKDRFMGWAYGSDTLIPLMKLMSKKNMTPEQFEKNFAKIIAPMLTGQKGIVAASREGELSPEFKDASLRLASEVGQGE